jgi:hypothetical protein
MSTPSFVERLKTMYRDPAWRDFATKNADHLFNNRTQIDRAVTDNLKYDAMKPGEKQMVSDPRNIDEFVPQLLKKWGITDMSKVLSEHEMKWDEGVAVLPDYILKVMKSDDSLGGDIIQWMVSKSEEVKAMASKFFAEASSTMVKYHELNITEKKQMFNIVFQYDNMKGKSALIDAGLQWPTKEMLTKDGHDPKIIDAYLDMTKASDYSFRLLNQGLAKRGMDPIEQIPGFMPHIHEGAYKVFIKATKEVNTPEIYIDNIKLISQ